MANEMRSPEVSTILHHPVPATAPTGRLSKWWPVSLFIAAVIFLIIGGGILGASTSGPRYYYDSSMFYGGIACLVLGGLLKLIAWILLIIWCVQGRRVQYPAVAYVNAPLQDLNALSIQSATQQHQRVGLAPYEPSITAKYCGHCGTPVATPFCTQCGVKG